MKKSKVAPIGWSYPKGYDCNGTQWRNYLRPAAKCMLAVLLCWLVSGLFLLFVV